MKQRDDGAGLGIAADRFPSDEVINQNNQEADAAEDPVAVVEQFVPQQRVRTGRLDGTCRQLGDNGKTFARR